MEALPQLANAALAETSFVSPVKDADDAVMVAGTSTTAADQPLRSKKIRARQACLQCRSHKVGDAHVSC